MDDRSFEVTIRTSNNEKIEIREPYENETFIGRVKLGDVVLWETEVTASIGADHRWRDDIKNIENAVFKQFAEALALLLNHFVKRA